MALSLNLLFNTPGDPNSGGIWSVVGKADLAGLAGVSLALSAVEFVEGTGFLSPASFEVQESADFGTHLDIVLMDDMENVVNDVGVVGTFVSTYVDDPALAPLSGQPDLGSFTGGVELATGTYLPGNLPDWFDNGSTSTLSNLFTGDTISLNRQSSVDKVNLATTLLTVRGTSVDFDDDGDVDGLDFLELQRGLGTIYDASHLAVWKANYGTVAPLSASSAAVPEPSSLLLLAAGIVALLLRSRRG